MKVKRYNAGVMLLIIAITIPITFLLYVLFLISPIFVICFIIFLVLFITSLFLIQTG